MELLTPVQALEVMYNYLRIFYEETGSDGIGSLLGDISLVSGGITADPAAWNDWIVALGKNRSVTIEEAFIGMNNFLKAYHERTEYSSKNIEYLLNQIKNLQKKDYNTSIYWNLWKDQAQKI